MQVDGLSGINRRLRPYGLKLNIAHYLSEPRVDLCRSERRQGQVPALVGLTYSHSLRSGILPAAP